MGSLKNLFLRQNSIHKMVKNMMCNQKWGKFREHGQSMVELAVILPLFLAFVLSIIEIGRAWAVKQSLTVAAREGARILAMPYGADLTFTSESQKQDSAVKAVTEYLANSGVVASADTQIVPIRLQPGGDLILGTVDDKIEENYSGGNRGDRIGIQIRHKFDTALPIILTMFNSNSPDQKDIKMGVTCYLEHE